MSALVASFSFAPAFAIAAPSEVAASGSVTLSVTVAEHRGIIVDNQQNVIEVFSNTDKNLIPVVYDGRYGGKTLPLTPALKSDYDQLMSQVAANHDMTITPAKVAFPVNFVDPTATSLFTVTPEAIGNDLDHKPYFVQLRHKGGSLGSLTN